jgi:rhodanese-related sulfurtransferase
MRRREVLIGTAAAAMAAAGTAALMWAADPLRAPWTLDPADPAVSLDDVEREVIARYRVADITPAALARMLASGEVLLFDVRTPEEHEAGHLPGALRVDPDETADGFLEAHGDRLRGRPLVFYCAVGVRSSRFMVRTLRQVAPHAAAGVYNLRGGVFRWTADGGALVSGTAPGRLHPYDENWGKLLARTRSPS